MLVALEELLEAKILAQLQLNPVFRTLLGILERIQYRIPFGVVVAVYAVATMLANLQLLPVVPTY